jgi:hypothetical protein
MWSRARSTVRLTSRCSEVLAPLIELRPHPTDYVFKNVHGGPIKPDNFYDIFRDVQRALEMPLRDLHATKDTYVSLALTSLTSRSANAKPPTSPAGLRRTRSRRTWLSTAAAPPQRSLYLPRRADDSFGASTKNGESRHPGSDRRPSPTDGEFGRNCRGGVGADTV